VLFLVWLLKFLFSFVLIEFECKEAELQWYSSDKKSKVCQDQLWTLFAAFESFENIFKRWRMNRQILILHYFVIYCILIIKSFQVHPGFFHVQYLDRRDRRSRCVSFLWCIAPKFREQSVMKIFVIADPWLKEREENSTRLSVFISPSHAVTRKGYLITLYRPSNWESNVTTLHQDEQSTSTSFFVVLWHWLPAILRGVWRCPFLWPHQF